MAYDQLASSVQLANTISGLKSKGYQVTQVKDKAEALEAVKKIVPAGAQIMNGASETLREIGLIEFLKSDQQPWVNLHTAILAEKDQAKAGLLRKQATLSNYYLGSVHALTEEGEFVVASNTASQLPNIVYSSDNLVFVVGSQKIVANLEEAMRRLDEYVVPLEDKRMNQVYGVGTQLNKVLLFKGEFTGSGRTIHFVIVEEKLGF